MKPEYQHDVNALSMLCLQSPQGQSIPLSAIANITQTVGPLTVTHLAQLPSATISFDTLPGLSLSQATAAIQQVAREILPATITTSFQGSAQVFNQSFSDLGWLLLVSILVIYLIDISDNYQSFYVTSSSAANANIALQLVYTSK
ncbi:MAG: efflux RND transporter permease subunit [Aulosira sp. DedQUE10]|nr:efflux RND transporter permease subunit [Aulosira sp. DedQUE10]